MKLVKLLIKNQEKKKQCTLLQQLDHMHIATIFRTSAVIVALTKVGNEVDDDHEHLPVSADLDPLSHLMNLVK